jgi:C4-dicarboxylate transporter, DctQ subunit
MGGKMLTRIGRIVDRILNYSFYAAIGILAFGWFAVCLEILMRYFLRRSMDWTFETTEYILAAITFIGAAWLLKHEGHVNMDVLVNAFKRRTQNLLQAITSIICAVACLIITWYGAEAAWYRWVQDIHFVTAMQPPSAPFIAIVPLGFLLLFIQFIRRAYKYMLEWKAGSTKTTEEAKPGISDSAI